MKTQTVSGHTRAVVAAVAVSAMVLTPAGQPAASKVLASTPAGSVSGIVDIVATLPYAHELVAATGVVVTSSGEVVTNNGVVRGATAIVVTDLDTGQLYSARVAGYDVSAEIAVLNLDHASNLPTATFGNSTSLAAGEPVTAYGNAGGRGGAPTAVQATVVKLDNSIHEYFFDGGEQALLGMTEIAAKLALGDSGGPLVAASGRTIGIVTAGTISARLPLKSNRGWAVPIDRARSIADAIEQGRSSPTIHIGPTAFLGIAFRPGAIFSGLTSGVTVIGIAPGSPAAKAGLKPGDIVTNCDGTAITKPNDLLKILLAKHPGSTITLAWEDVLGSSHQTRLTLDVGPPQ